MNPAEVVIKELGGIRPGARLLDCNPGTIWHWKQVGRVPSKRHNKILEVCEGRVLPEELVVGRDEDD